MSILDMLKEVAIEVKAFENHPVKHLPLEERILYLQGLSLLMNVDGDIHVKEEAFLQALVQSFDLDKSFLTSCIEFAKDPEKSVIQQFATVFRGKMIAENFIFDALILSYKDEKFVSKESEALDWFRAMLGISFEQFEMISSFYQLIANKKWEEANYHLSISFMDKSKFDYIFYYYSVNIDLFKEKFETKRLDHLEDCFKGKPLTNELLLPHFQHSLDINRAVVENEEFLIDDKSLSLNENEFFYNEQLNQLSVSKTKPLSGEQLYHVLSKVLNIDDLTCIYLFFSDSIVEAKSLGRNKYNVDFKSFKFFTIDGSLYFINIEIGYLGARVMLPGWWDLLGAAASAVAEGNKKPPVTFFALAEDKKKIIIENNVYDLKLISNLDDFLSCKMIRWTK